MSRGVGEITSRLLARLPLPRLPAEADKERRGRVLVVGGSATLAGSVALAAEAALRAGAGKVQVLTPAPAAPVMATLVPEAWVGPVSATRAGGFRQPSLLQWMPAEPPHALLIGPGLATNQDGVLVAQSLASQHRDVPAVVDAMALQGLTRFLRGRRAPVVITPHAGEMAALCSRTKDQVLAEPLRWARYAAERFGVVVLLKGRHSFVAAPDGTAWRSQSGNLGLATAGSGDVLAGILAAVLARRTEPVRAAMWATHVHGRCGDLLAKTVGPLGWLARDILPIIPQALRQAGGR